MNLPIRFKQFGKKKGLAAMIGLVFLAACGPTDFPHSPRSNGLRNVPFVDTYNFGFKTGGTPIQNPEGNLLIVSATDARNLLFAANIPVRKGTAVISGVVRTKEGSPVKDVLILATDRQGNPVGDLFYNSFAAIPDFVQFSGTTENGGFTIFNVPPGEIYLKAAGGGRGNSQLIAFPNSVSAMTMEVDPVLVVPIQSVAEIREISEAPPASAVQIFLEGGAGDSSPLIPLAVTDPLSGSAKFVSRSEGIYLVRLVSQGYVDTYQSMVTGRAGLANGATVLTHFFKILSVSDKMKWSGGISSPLIQGSGILAGRIRQEDQSARPGSVIEGYRADGMKVGQVVYFKAGEPDFSLTGTSNDGRFIIFNLPPGPLFVRVTAEEQTGGPINHYSAAETIYIFPDSATYQDLTLKFIAPPDPLKPADPTCYPVNVSGKVTETNEVTPVVNASLSALGVFFATTGGELATTGSDGSYTVKVPYLVPSSPECKFTVPFSANGNYWVKVSGAGRIDTYQQISLTQGDQKDKNLLSLTAGQLTSYANDSSVQQNPAHGLISGVILDKRTGKTAEGVSLKLKDLSGVEKGSIRYFSLDGTPSQLNQSTKDGRYMIYNLPPDIYQISISSEDDSGDIPAITFAGGVTFQNLEVNNAANSTVYVTGTPVNFMTDKPLSTTQLNVLGEKNSLISTGTFSGIFSSNGTFTVESHGAGLIDSYHFFVKSLLKETKDVTLHGVLSSDVNSLAGTLGVFLNPSQGIIMGKTVTPEFKLSNQFSLTPGSGNGIAQGFFNEDDLLDFAVIDFSSNSILIYYGNGDGTFRLGQTLKSDPACLPESVSCFAGTGPVAILQIDLNQDKQLDLAVVNQNSGSVAILLGSRKGVFRFHQSVPVGSGPTSIASGDFDRDGFVDLVIGVGGKIPPALSFIYNDKNTNFTLKSTLNLSAPPLSLGVVDIDQDQLLDVLVGTSDALLVLRGIGLPQPGIETYAFPHLTQPPLLLMSDFDGDGKIDAAILDRQRGNLRVYLRNNKIKDIKGNLIDIRFGSPSCYPVACDTANSTTATFSKLIDFNQDGFVDLVVSYANSQIALFPGKGDGTFNPPFYYPSGGLIDTFTLGDVDGNGMVDLIGLSTFSSSVIVLKGENLPLDGVSVSARSMESLDLGTVWYLEPDGSINTMNKRFSTSSGGKFIILNVPSGLAWLRAQGGGAGGEIINVYPNAASILDLSTHPYSPLEVAVSGFVFDSVQTPIGDSKVSFLGASVEAVTGPVKITQTGASDTGGDYEVTLPAHSPYIVKLTRP